MALALKSTVLEVLKIWNQQCKAGGVDIEYFIDTKGRKKKYYLSKHNFYEQDVAELIFRSVGDGENKLLWRKELRLPPKVKGMTKQQVINDFEDDLYRFFLYECLGNFAVTTSQLIDRQDYSEYDMERDRISGHPAFKDHVIEVTEAGAFYEKGDQFDIFNKLDGGWAVYTAHEIGIPNNGLAKIPFEKCKIVKETEQKVELFIPIVPKIILPPNMQQ